MDTLVGSGTLQFGHFRFDRHARKLSRQNAAGDWDPVALGSRASEVLAVLTNKPGEVVSRDAIMDAVWPGVAVEPNNMTVQMAALRRVLDEGGPGESCIQTVPGRGYRFISDITRTVEAALSPTFGPAADPGLAKAATRWWRLRWRGRGAGSGGRTVAGAVADPKRPAPAGLQVPSQAYLMARVVVLLVGGIAGVAWWMLHSTTAPPPSATVGLATAQDRRQSVIVVPFENSSGIAEQDAVAAAITYELTDHLARRHDGPVIPATVVAAHGGKMVDPSAVGRQYGVHFVLVGNARRQDGRLIASAIVYETAGGQRVWSRQFDRQDGPDTQEAIVQSIYESFFQVSVDEEGERAMREHPNSLDARDLILAALSTRLATETKAHIDEKIALIERALTFEPNNFKALERQARLRSARVMAGYSSDPTADLTIAANAADHMLTINANSLLSLRAKSFVLRAQRNWSEAEAVLRRAIDLQPTEANRRAELGVVLLAEGRHLEALESFQKAKRLAGGSDPVYRYEANIAMAELALDQFAAAIAAARQSLSGYPPNSGRFGEVPWLALIAAESGSGEDDAARADLHKFLATSRALGSIAEIEKWPTFGANPKLLDGLRRAGMPAE
jgi:DNA-binding winged helix-turn-helix (wHTH) protein/TolB-like protein/Flp pilus assembly protein TadD